MEEGDRGQVCRRQGCRAHCVRPFGARDAWPMSGLRFEVRGLRERLKANG